MIFARHDLCRNPELDVQENFINPYNTLNVILLITRDKDKLSTYLELKFIQSLITSSHKNVKSLCAFDVFSNAIVGTRFIRRPHNHDLIN